MGKKHAGSGWRRVTYEHGLRRLVPDSTPAALVLIASVLVAVLVCLYALLR